MAKKVLVVDDEKLIVKGIRFSLEQDGMTIGTLENSRICWQTDNPSSFGSIRSRRIISYSFSFAMESASSPSYARKDREKSK